MAAMCTGLKAVCGASSWWEVVVTAFKLAPRPVAVSLPFPKEKESAAGLGLQGHMLPSRRHPDENCTSLKPVPFAKGREITA